MIPGSIQCDESKSNMLLNLGKDKTGSFTWSGIVIRSLFTNVKTLLSSMTLFMFSIQTASTGPSNKIHFSSVVDAVQSCNNHDVPCKIRCILKANLSSSIERLTCTA